MSDWHDCDDTGLGSSVPHRVSVPTGNKPLLATCKTEHDPATRRSKDTASVNGDSSSSGDSSRMVMYHGAVVDIHSVMTQLERSEKSRTAVEAKLKSIQQDMGTYIGSVLGGRASNVMFSYIHIFCLTVFQYFNNE